jgi:hypothetical protein
MSRPYRFVLNDFAWFWGCRMSTLKFELNQALRVRSSRHTFADECVLERLLRPIANEGGAEQQKRDDG